MTTCECDHHAFWNPCILSQIPIKTQKNFLSYKPPVIWECMPILVMTGATIRSIWLSHHCQVVLLTLRQSYSTQQEPLNWCRPDIDPYQINIHLRVFAIWDNSQWFTLIYQELPFKETKVKHNKIMCRVYHISWMYAHTTVTVAMSHVLPIQSKIRTRLITLNTNSQISMNCLSIQWTIICLFMYFCSAWV